MYIKLQKNGAPFGYSNVIGETIEVSEKLGLYMIECGACIEVDKPKKEESNQEPTKAKSKK